ncbi:hypothetical protein SBF1_750004 [Candidatus Desulfosporosinus infrequens]|uniref:Uncharacterized protein n=1 Tax=Candidatus Desulfosporosinus infrequens TaxID=2043169 RepID=A0A2U3LRB4_9FIRM|nr:hypothetical protein SBF1_750004 [Candidatus Desulfosporosinus infrequens]
MSYDIYDERQYEKDRKIVNESRDTTKKPREFSYDQWRNFQQTTFEKAYQMTAHDSHRHTDCSQKAWEADMKKNLKTLVNYEHKGNQAKLWDQWAESYVGEKMHRGDDGWHKAPAGGRYFDPSNLREKGSAWRETFAAHREKFRSAFESVDNWRDKQAGQQPKSKEPSRSSRSISVSDVYVNDRDQHSWIYNSVINPPTWREASEDDRKFAAAKAKNPNLVRASDLPRGSKLRNDALDQYASRNRSRGMER